MILTNRCNLSCRHCVLHNNFIADETRYTFEQIVSDMCRRKKKDEQKALEKKSESAKRAIVQEIEEVQRLNVTENIDKEKED